MLGSLPTFTVYHCTQPLQKFAKIIAKICKNHYKTLQKSLQKFVITGHQIRYDLWSKDIQSLDMEVSLENAKSSFVRATVMELLCVLIVIYAHYFHFRFNWFLFYGILLLSSCYLLPHKHFRVRPIFIHFRVPDFGFQPIVRSPYRTILKSKGFLVWTSTIKLVDETRCLD